MTGAMIFLLLAVALCVSAGYAVACQLWPFMRCRRCHGSGRRTSPTGRAYGRCRKCKGTGERLRLGRRFWNWAAGTAHKAVG